MRCWSPGRPAGGNDAGGGRAARLLVLGPRVAGRARGADPRPAGGERPAVAVEVVEAVECVRPEMAARLAVAAAKRRAGRHCSPQTEGGSEQNQRSRQRAGAAAAAAVAAGKGRQGLPQCADAGASRAQSGFASTSTTVRARGCCRPGAGAATCRVGARSRRLNLLVDTAAPPSRLDNAGRWRSAGLARASSSPGSATREMVRATGGPCTPGMNAELDARRGAPTTARGRARRCPRAARFDLGLLCQTACDRTGFLRDAAATVRGTVSWPSPMKSWRSNGGIRHARQAPERLLHRLHVRHLRRCLKQERCNLRMNMPAGP